MTSLQKYIYLMICILTCPLTALAGPVNVSTADAETISAELQGIGLSKAKAIVAYRAEHGPFKSRAELTAVKGIGARTVEINRDNIVLQAGKEKTKR